MGSWAPRSSDEEDMEDNAVITTKRASMLTDMKTFNDIPRQTHPAGGHLPLAVKAAAAVGMSAGVGGSHGSGGQDYGDEYLADAFMED